MLLATVFIRSFLHMIPVCFIAKFHAKIEYNVKPNQRQHKRNDLCKETHRHIRSYTICNISIIHKQIKVIHRDLCSIQTVERAASERSNWREVTRNSALWNCDPEPIASEDRSYASKAIKDNSATETITEKRQNRDSQLTTTARVKGQHEDTAVGRFVVMPKAWAVCNLQCLCYYGKKIASVTIATSSASGDHGNKCCLCALGKLFTIIASLFLCTRAQI